MNELLSIKEGKYSNQVLTCRSHLENEDKITYKKIKSQLPAVTFSGQFNGSHKSENLHIYSQFIIIDIDALESTKIEQIKALLFSDVYVAAIWVSPSGCGLKVLIKVANQSDEHKLCFDSLSWYLSEKYDVVIDKSGSDVCRLCFVSYDEKLLIKETSEVFDFHDVASPSETLSPTKSLVERKTELLARNHQYSEGFLFNGTKNRNLEANRVMISKIIKFLSKHNESITTTYNDWFRVACAIANTFTYNLGEKYFLSLCRLDGPLHDEYKSQQLLEYCYRNRKIDVIDFSTIVFLAKQKGFVVSLK